MTTFSNKEQYLAWSLQQSNKALEEALQMPKIMLSIAITAIIVDNNKALEQSGYTDLIEPEYKDA